MSFKSKQFSRVHGLRSERKRVRIEPRTATQHRKYGDRSTGNSKSLFKI